MSSQISTNEDPPADVKPRFRITLPPNCLRNLWLTPISIITYFATNTFATILRAIVKTVKVTLGAAVDLKTVEIEKQEEWTRLKARSTFEQTIAEEDELIEAYVKYVNKIKTKYVGNDEAMRYAEQLAHVAFQKQVEAIRQGKQSWLKRLLTWLKCSPIHKK